MYDKRFTLAFNDKMSNELAKLIIGYESLVRSADKGAVCFDLVMEAADLELYPPELRARLDELLGKDIKRYE